MEELGAGLYEVLVTEGLHARLEALAKTIACRAAGLASRRRRQTESPGISSQEIERALNDVGELIGLGSVSKWHAHCSIA